MLQPLQGKRKWGGTIGTDHNNTNGDTKKIKTEIVQLKAEEVAQATPAQIVQPKAGHALGKDRGYGTNMMSKQLQQKQRKLVFNQASAIVRPDDSFLNDLNAKAQAAGSLYERNTFVDVYQYRRVTNTAESQKIADKLRELSNAQKLMWFNIYSKGAHKKLGELYYKKLFKHQDIAYLLSSPAATQPPKARPAHTAHTAPPEITPEIKRTREEQIMHYYPGLRGLNQQAQADGSAYERNTFRKCLLGYTFLPRGNAYLTRRARELSNATSKLWFNVHCSRYGTLPRLGLLVQNSILVTAKRCEEETREYRESLRAKKNAAKGSEEKTDQTRAKLAKKLPTEIPKKDRLAKGNPVSKGVVLKAKKKTAEGFEKKVSQTKAKEGVKKLPTEIPKIGHVAKDIIDLVSDDEGELPLQNLEPTASWDASSDEESSVDSAEFDSDWDPEKDDVEGVLVGETYEHENGPRRTRSSHGVTGGSQRLGSVWMDDEGEEGEGEEEDEELRRLEGRVKHEPDGGEDGSVARQAPGFREDITALGPTPQEVHAQIKAEMKSNGCAGWQDVESVV